MSSENLVWCCFLTCERRPDGAWDTLDRFWEGIQGPSAIIWSSGSWLGSWLWVSEELVTKVTPAKLERQDQIWFVLQDLILNWCYQAEQWKGLAFQRGPVQCHSIRVRSIWAAVSNWRMMEEELLGARQRGLHGTLLWRIGLPVGQFATRWSRKTPWTLCLLLCWARLVSVEQLSGLISEETTAIVPELGWQVVGNVFLFCCLRGLELQCCPCGDIPQCLACPRGRLSRQDRPLSVRGLCYLASRGNQRPIAVSSRTTHPSLLWRRLMLCIGLGEEAWSHCRLGLKHSGATTLVLLEHNCSGTWMSLNYLETPAGTLWAVFLDTCYGGGLVK